MLLSAICAGLFVALARHGGRCFGAGVSASAFIAGAVMAAQFGFDLEGVGNALGAFVLILFLLSVSSGGSGDTRLLDSVLDILLIEGSTRQALSSKYEELKQEYDRQAVTIRQLVDSLNEECKELTKLRVARLLDWLKDLKVVWLEQRIDSVSLAIKANRDNIRDLKEEIRSTLGEISDLEDEMAEQQRQFTVALRQQKYDSQSFFSKPQTFRKRRSNAVQPFGGYIPSKFCRQAIGFAPRAPTQEVVLPLHAAAVAAQASRSYPALQLELPPAPALQFGLVPTLTVPPSPSSGWIMEDTADAPVAPVVPDEMEICTPPVKPPVKPPVTLPSPTGLSPLAVTLYISPLAGPASALVDNGQEDVDMVSPPASPMRNLRRQFATTTPSPSPARYGFPASAPSPAPVTPAVPLSLASTSAPAVAALPETPAQVTTTAKAHAAKKRFRPNGNRRPRPAPTADPPPQTHASSSTSAPAPVRDVIAPSGAPAKGPAQDACAPVLPSASTQPRTMSKVAQPQDSGGAAPSLSKTTSDAAMQHGNSAAPAPAPKKSRSRKATYSKGKERKRNPEPLAGSLGVPTAQNGGPANSSAVNSEPLATARSETGVRSCNSLMCFGHGPLYFRYSQLQPDAKNG
ncbi:hypothetical protein QBC34DRAFT_498045 [Podospora aff. communis PSN243]|uniref:Uncharacterized protein n=1 Tax=Podospora aff. communis PSN243 TaxID=3040156 RepID=A0AAV9GA93_9PEZI|nr:hypothetical protein QBC34DRAFT_498045 [Podospora aff. communis PSN243]